MVLEGRYIQMARRSWTVEFRGQDRATTKASRMEMKTIVPGRSSVPRGSRLTEEMRQIMPQTQMETPLAVVTYCSYGRHS